MTTSEQIIELKGSSFTLSILHLHHADVSLIIQATIEKIKQAPQFFLMAPIVINVEAVIDHSIDYVNLKTSLESLKLVPVGITGGNEAHKLAAHQAGLASMTTAKNVNPSNITIVNEGPTQIRYERVEVPVEVKVPTYTATKVIRQNLRSGQQIYAKDSDLVIIGAVSNGAEVIADGSIHVYGTLRGRAIAGAKGENDAKIFTHKLEAELVSINGNYWTSEQMHQRGWQKPGIIYLDGDNLAVQDLEI